MEIKIWILTSALIIVISILGFILRAISQQILKRLDDMVDELKVLNEMKTMHDQQIKFIQEGQSSINSRLNNHGERIRVLEKSH